MAKLYFRYGTVGSAKTLNLLSVVHTYRKQGKTCLLVKPALDTRFGKKIVRSRSGLEEKADIVLKADERIWLPWKKGKKSSFIGFPHSTLKIPHCILVDEVQFLSSYQIDELRSISTIFEIPTICYGLRTDFKGNLFPASKRLFELADSIEEIKNVCHYCTHKSTMNLKHVNGKATRIGPSIELGAEEKYFPVCYKCYNGAFVV